MQRIMLLLPLIFSAFLSNAQSYPGVRLYAYSQSVARGTRPQRVIDENNVVITVKENPGQNIWIYLTFPAKVPIYPSELYIDGKKHTLNAVEIHESPVVHKHYISPDVTDTTVLVPRTADKILSVLPGGIASFSPPTALKNLIVSNEVVVGYTVKNKKYYTTAKKLKKLPPVAMM
ncbi:MAG: hypothetical protein ICV51_17610 [Flavisolibacter sp.]|nr:hypothetical protein [Flavisolibacter sp.]MBD0350704.1 hypothetical protein [Flavisolibacter sp.]MBD0377433.1 hypothetical protein [Flavisolibacter sp.]